DFPRQTIKLTQHRKINFWDDDDGDDRSVEGFWKIIDLLG
ncbi:MAG: hypothetical protein ACI90V_002121, partial [Bacillariaceae sp.]